MLLDWISLQERLDSKPRELSPALVIVITMPRQTWRWEGIIQVSHVFKHQIWHYELKKKGKGKENALETKGIWKCWVWYSLAPPLPSSDEALKEWFLLLVHHHLLRFQFFCFICVLHSFCTSSSSNPHLEAWEVKVLTASWKLSHYFWVLFHSFLFCRAPSMMLILLMPVDVVPDFDFFFFFLRLGGLF